MKKLARHRAYIAATISAALWSLVAVAGVLAGGSTGPFPK